MPLGSVKDIGFLVKEISVGGYLPTSITSASAYKITEFLPFSFDSVYGGNIIIEFTDLKYESKHPEYYAEYDKVEYYTSGNTLNIILHNVKKGKYEGEYFFVFNVRPRISYLMPGQPRYGELYFEITKKDGSKHRISKIVIYEIQSSGNISISPIPKKFALKKTFSIPKRTSMFFGSVISNMINYFLRNEYHIIKDVVKIMIILYAVNDKVVATNYVFEPIIINYS